ncbi:ubiquinol-cytochrome C chaperone family protein [Hyphococcus sp.]|uniref:ubiquinol-cytochrome C chaperone family protein n=1 Tax=Hyphococcus sp. TaxID=2038636 RepID=UPI003CCB78C3
MLKAFFRKNPALEAGGALYAKAVEQARLERFYTDHGVPDTAEGRFEMVALHVYLLMRRLKASDGDDARRRKDVSQCLFDTMFQNMDDSLREMGVGDLAVARKIRALAENFYGRLGAYEAALKTDAPVSALAEALSRNVYEEKAAPQAHALAQYVIRADGALAGQPLNRIAGGIALFPEPEEVKS